MRSQRRMSGHQPRPVRFRSCRVEGVRSASSGGLHARVTPPRRQQRLSARLHASLVMRAGAISGLQTEWLSTTSGQPAVVPACPLIRQRNSADEVLPPDYQLPSIRRLRVFGRVGGAPARPGVRTARRRPARQRQPAGTRHQYATPGWFRPHSAICAAGPRRYATPPRGDPRRRPTNTASTRRSTEAPSR
jgi:hypothetical protein